MQFTEHSLELSIMELFENEGYTHQTGQDIHREKTDVLLPELLATFYAQCPPSHKRTRQFYPPCGIHQQKSPCPGSSKIFWCKVRKASSKRNSVFNRCLLFGNGASPF